MMHTSADQSSPLGDMICLIDLLYGKWQKVSVLVFTGRGRQSRR